MSISPMRRHASAAGQARPQHGIAVPWRYGPLLVSRPSPRELAKEKGTNSLPVGFRLLDARDVLLVQRNRPEGPSASFRGYPVQAATCDLNIFGCLQREPDPWHFDVGVVLLRETERGADARTLCNPTSVARAGSPRAAAARSWGKEGKLGDYRAFWRIDPGAPDRRPSDGMPVAGVQITCQFVFYEDRLGNLTSEGIFQRYRNDY